MKWKLVPVEPTEAMREAYFACVPNRTSPINTAVQKWDAMLSAAPTPRPEGRLELYRDELKELSTPQLVGNHNYKDTLNRPGFRGGSHI